MKKLHLDEISTRRSSKGLAYIGGKHPIDLGYYTGREPKIKDPVINPLLLDKLYEIGRIYVETVKKLGRGEIL